MENASDENAKGDNQSKAERQVKCLGDRDGRAGAWRSQPAESGERRDRRGADFVRHLNGWPIYFRCPPKSSIKAKTPEAIDVTFLLPYARTKNDRTPDPPSRDRLQKSELYPCRQGITAACSCTKLYALRQASSLSNSPRRSRSAYALQSWPQ